MRRDFSDPPDDALGLTCMPSRHLSVSAIVEIAVLADQMGYHSIWIPETWGVDAVSLLALVARSTERILVCSGVMNVYSRSPALIAQTAATLQEISDGRFVLGLGTSGPGVVENWHGLPFQRPLQRTREYVSIIRQALSGERVSFAGKIFQVEGFRLLNAPDTPVPILIASIGPRNIQLTAEIADGWLPIFAPLGDMATLTAQFQAAVREVRQDAGHVLVAAYIPGLVGPRAARLLRQQLAYYVGGMGTYYAAFMARLGFADQAQRLQVLWREGDRRAAVEAVPEDMLRACTLGPDPVHAMQRLAAYRARGVAVPVIALPNETSAAEARATVEALAPQGHPL